MTKPALHIIEAFRAQLARNRRRSPQQIPDAEVRIYMARHPEETQAMVDAHIKSLPGIKPSARWTAPMVKSVIVSALEMLQRTESRVGPSRLRAAHIETSDGWGYASDFTKTSPFAKGMTVSRMESVLIGIGSKESWLNGDLLNHPIEREKLIVWAMAQVGSRPVAMVCKKRGWARRTFTYHVTVAATHIARRLDREGIEPWQ